MKALTFFSTLFLFCAGQLLAQCPPGNVYFTTQKEIDDFGKKCSGCERIAGNLYIGTADIPLVFNNLSGLSHIRYIDSSLHILGTLGLQDLQGLENLHGVGKNVVIKENRDLVSLHGLSQLRHIGGNFQVVKNAKLERLDEPAQLARIQGDFFLLSNEHLSSLQGLNRLGFVGRHFFLRSNPSLMTLAGLEQLDTVGAYLTISHSSLNDLTGLAQLRYAKNIQLNDNERLLSLNGPRQLTITAVLYLDNNKVLHDISLLKKLKHTDQLHLEIRWCGIKNFLSLSGIRSLGGLTLYSTHIGSFAGLENLERVGTLHLEGNRALKNLSGLDGLKIIEKDLILSQNYELTSLHGLENLIYIGTSVDICFNALSDLQAFNHPIHFMGEQLAITKNVYLRLCGVEAVCQWLNRSNAIDKVYIGNEAGCSTVAEVQASCRTRQDISSPLVSLQPNPVQSQLEIEVADAPDAPLILQVRDASGRLVLPPQSFLRTGKFDVHFLSPGVYWIEIQGENQTWIERFVKI